MDTPILPQSNKKPVGGIYQWTQISTGKKYIGSTKNFAKRRSEHVRKMKRGIHQNTYFLKHWQESGSKDFVFEVLEIVEDSHQRIEREQHYLDNVIRWGFDFNILTNASTAGRAGSKVSESTRKKMSESRKGRAFSDEHKEKISAALKGKANSKGVVRSEATRKAISETHKSRGTRPPGTLGRKHTEAERKVISEKRKKQVIPDDQKKKFAEYWIGRKHTEETKQKMRESYLRRTKKD